MAKRISAKAMCVHALICRANELQGTGQYSQKDIDLLNRMENPWRKEQLPTTDELHAYGDELRKLANDLANKNWW